MILFKWGDTERGDDDDGDENDTDEAWIEPEEEKNYKHSTSFLSVDWQGWSQNKSQYK